MESATTLRSVAEGGGGPESERVVREVDAASVDQPWRLMLADNMDERDEVFSSTRGRQNAYYQAVLRIGSAKWFTTKFEKPSLYG